MWKVIDRRGLCMETIVMVGCSCGEKRIPAGHMVTEDGIVHRRGVPCYNIDEHHVVVPTKGN